MLHASFKISLFYLYWKLAIIYLFIDNTHDFPFCFYLYNVREENTFYFDEFENIYFHFVYFHFVVIIIIPNMRRNLSSLIVHSNTKPKFLERATCGFTNVWLWNKENVFHLYGISFQKYLCSRKRHLGVPKGMFISWKVCPWDNEYTCFYKSCEASWLD